MICVCRRSLLHSSDVSFCFISLIQNISLILKTIKDTARLIKTPATFCLNSLFLRLLQDRLLPSAHPPFGCRQQPFFSEKKRFQKQEIRDQARVPLHHAQVHHLHFPHYPISEY